jgi:hypothetical protein
VFKSLALNTFFYQDVHTFTINAPISGLVNFVTFLGYTMSYDEAVAWCSAQTSPMSNLTLHRLIMSPFPQEPEIEPPIVAATSSKQIYKYDSPK